MAEGDLDLKSAGEIVPSLYYDLIARVCAGVPFVLLLVYWKQKDLGGLISMFGASGAALLVVLFGYLAGLLATPLAGLFAGPIQLALKRKLKLRDLGSMEYLLEISRRSDAITLKDRAMGAVLGKMGAEKILCQNLLLGAVALAFLHERLSAAIEWTVIALLVVLVIQRNVAFLLRQQHL